MQVAQMLAQILKTDSLDVIKHWLMEAPDKGNKLILTIVIMMLPILISANRAVFLSGFLSETVKSQGDWYRNILTIFH